MNNYYAPYQRPIGYYNPSIPNGQEMTNAQTMPQYQPQMLQNIQMPQATGDLIFVLNETEAMAYPVAPNNSVTLWDKNNDTVYIKSANMQGVPSMRILDYKERNINNTTKNAENIDNFSKNFVKITDFNELQERIKVLENNVKSIMPSRGQANE